MAQRTGPRLFDTHCHLTLTPSESPQAVWERSVEAGADRALVVGIDIATSRTAADFVQGRDGLYASAGIHPNSSQGFTAHDLAEIRRIAGQAKVLAIGESGLDFYREHAAHDVQVRCLEEHAELAVDLERPLILHIRDAFQRTGEVLQPFVERGLRAVVHCFTGGPQDLHPFLDYGFYISFSGVLTYPNAPKVRDAARAVPLERLLVETDAPYLAPVPMRGRTNEPAFIVHTANKLAEVRDLSYEKIARITTDNACRLFGIG